MYVVGSCCLYVACARVHTSIYIYIYIYEIEICLLIVMTFFMNCGHYYFLYSSGLV